MNKSKQFNSIIWVIGRRQSVIKKEAITQQVNIFIPAHKTNVGQWSGLIRTTAAETSVAYYKNVGGLFGIYTESTCADV